MEDHRSCIAVAPRATDWNAEDGNIPFKSVSADWSKHLDFFERQKFGFETDACVLFASHESFDAQMDALIESGSIPQPVLDEFAAMGYMDSASRDGKPHFHSSPRFLHILAGTGTNGTPLPAPWDIQRGNGALPWVDLPFNEAMTQQQYFDPASITPEMRAKAQRFLQLIGGKSAIQYHWIANGFSPASPFNRIAKALPQAPVCIGTPVCEPWDQDQPPVCPSMAPEHSTMAYAVDYTSSVIRILDHYIPFLKALPFAYNVPYAMQGIVSPTFTQPAPGVTVNPIPTDIQPTQQNVDRLTKILSLWQIIVSLFNKGRNPTSADMDNQYPWYVSSTGVGIAQRIISLSALVIPVLSAFGINIAPGDAETVINSALVITFAVWHGFAWLRANAYKDQKLGKYAPPQA